jgi:hypothetical protein
VNGVDIVSRHEDTDPAPVLVGDVGVPKEWNGVLHSLSFSGSFRESRPGVCGKVAAFPTSVIAVIGVISNPIFTSLLAFPLNFFSFTRSSHLRSSKTDKSREELMKN